MTEMYEIERFLEEHMEYGLGLGLLSNGFSSLMGIAVYILTSLALYTLASRRGIKHAWLSWFPLVNSWIIGSLSDQYRYVVKGEVKNKRKILLILNIIYGCVLVAMIGVVVAMIVSAVDAAMGGAVEAVIMDAVMGPVLGILGLCLPLAGISIATAVVRFMALYDIYTSCTPQNNVIFLVLSILFPVTQGFFLFFTRNKDDGMPPRKQESGYEAPQEPWSNTEYL